MKADIRTNVEIDMAIHAQGIAARFCEWFACQPQYGIYDSYNKVHVDPLNPHLSVPWNLAEIDVYGVDCYVFGLYRQNPYRGNKQDTLLIHLYQNVPVQAFHEFAPKFFAELGIDAIDGDDRYLGEVAKSISVLKTNPMDES